MEGSILRWLRGRTPTSTSRHPEQDHEKREQEFRRGYFKRPPPRAESRPTVCFEFPEGAGSMRTATASGTWRTREGTASTAQGWFVSVRFAHWPMGARTASGKAEALPGIVGAAGEGELT